jgi:hypothetical protein
VRFLLMLVAVSPYCMAQRAGGEYVIEFLRSEEAAASPAFSIVRAEPSADGLRLFLDTSRPDVVAGLLGAGAFEAQLSDHRKESATNHPISLGKAVWCYRNGTPIYLGYTDPLPECDGNPPARIEYFFEVPVTLGPDQDLAIGQDPDFLWLIEVR